MSQRVAHRYSKALMDLAIERGQVDAIKADLDGIRKANTPELQRFLLSPVIQHEKKIQVFDAIFGGKILPETDAFFKLLFHKGREVSINAILDAFDELYRRKKGIEIVQLTTAIPASDEIRQQVLQQLGRMERYQGKTIQLREKVDESLLGGFVLQMGDDLFDASIIRDLKDIRKQFVENLYIQQID